MYSIRNSRGLTLLGFPIRKSLVQSFFPAPQSLSQVCASFIASRCQGIHQQPLLAWSKSNKFCFSMYIEIYYISILFTKKWFVILRCSIDCFHATKLQENCDRTPCSQALIKISLNCSTFDRFSNVTHIFYYFNQLFAIQKCCTLLKLLD